jgi:aryl-alcohol dehydrogenase-like predicted oxidoreductase
MKYNQLGNSGLVVSELSLGTMNFGKGLSGGLNLVFDEKQATNLVDKAIDFGINLFDTADIYSEGESELILGKALKGKRKDVLIATKHSFRSGKQPFNVGVNTKHLIEQTENSLKALNTDYLDIVLLHNDDPITPIDETLRAMENLVQQGKVRYIGLSNYQAWKAATMIQRQKDLNFQPFTASQMHYSILNREMEHEFIPMSLHHGLGMMVWSPLSSGFLTGKYTKENPEPEGARLNSFDLGLFDRSLGYEVVEKLNQIAEKHNNTVAEVSIAWLLAKKIVSTVIVGVSKLTQLESNVNATKINLTTIEIEEIDNLTKPEVRYPATFIDYQDKILLNSIK